MTKEELYHALTKHRKVVSPKEAAEYIEKNFDKDAIYLELTRHRNLLTLQEAASYLRVGSQTVKNYVKDENLPGEKMGGKWLFDRAALDVWLTDRFNSKL